MEEIFTLYEYLLAISHICIPYFGKRGVTYPFSHISNKVIVVVTDYY